MKELGEGTRDVIVSTLGWDINPRVLGIVPKEAKVFVLANTHWIPDTQFMCIPKGVPADKMPALVALMAHMLKPEAQAVTYDKGYFYPGPAVKGVTLAMAPQESRDILAEYGRPEYDGLITSLPTRPPLTPERLVAAFRRWDQEIGVGHGAPQ
jgi:putative spermidine/putrescine transport system substrate-binding protein